MPILLDDLADFFREGKPTYHDFGGEITSPLGGPAQRINRLGNRFGITVTLAPVPEEPDGRTLAAKLRLAKQQGAVYPWPQPGLDIGSPGSPVVDGAVAGGTSIPVRGLTPGYVIRFGQFLSIVRGVGGRRYLHSAAAESTANGSGDTTLIVDPMLRVSLVDGDVIELAQPMIEGLLESGDLDWSIMLEPFTSLSFTINESE